MDRGFRHRLRRDPRHDDQPISVLLAGGAGDRGGEAEPFQAAVRRAERRGCRDRANPPGYADRHGLQQHRRGRSSSLPPPRRCNAHGITDDRDVRPGRPGARAGCRRFAFLLFAFGIIGTGLLAVPVLAGSAAYAVSEMLGRPASLDAKPLNARLFYGTIAIDDLGRRVDPIGRDQPGASALLERGDQRRARGAADGGHDADRRQSPGDGSSHLGHARERSSAGPRRR